MQPVGVTLRALLIFCSLTTFASACPFCPGLRLTLSQQVSRSDAVVLVQWVETQQKSQNTPAHTTLQTIHALKNPGDVIQTGQRIKLARYQPGNKGDLFLLTGKKKTLIEWDPPLEVTETSYQYIVQAPPLEARPQDRLSYFLKFLEYPDNTIADDAYFEFTNSDYKDVVLLAHKLPRDRLRRWLSDPGDFTNPRLGLYGMMLGLCGNDRDAKLLARHITAPTEEMRIGIDGMIGGYLLLVGARGLDLIDEKKLKDRKSPTTEIFSTLQALRFLWTYGNGRIEKERLRQSVRLLVGRPDLADIAITDLARWKDWSIQDRLMTLFDHKDYDNPLVKRAIVSYMIVSGKDTVSGSGSKPPAHVVKGQRYLAELWKKDPQTVRQAERFFLK